MQKKTATILITGILAVCAVGWSATTAHFSSVEPALQSEASEIAWHSAESSGSADEQAETTQEPQAESPAESATADEGAQDEEPASESTAWSIRPTPEGTPYQQYLSRFPQENGSQLPHDVELAAADRIDEAAGESLEGVTLEGGTLTIKMDISHAKLEQGRTLKSLAMWRAGQIATDILALPQYGSAWDAIVFDFGSVGRIVCNRSQLENDGYGWFFSITDKSFIEGEPTEGERLQAITPIAISILQP